MSDDIYDAMARAVLPAPLRFAASREALARVVGRRLADGWAWTPRGPGVEVLLPPEADPRSGWETTFSDELSPGRLVPHWAVGTAEDWGAKP